MELEPTAFYDAIAENYHLVFEDWNASIEREAGIFDGLFRRELSDTRLRILDCACGIGTQTLGLASHGHTVVASDLSSVSITRARREAVQRGLAVTFQVADMRSLQAVQQNDFDVVFAADNALPHLIGEHELQRAVEEMARKLRSGGLFAASIRDYDEALLQRRVVQGPYFYADGPYKRIVHQIWHWMDDRVYTFHLYITRETNAGWECQHYSSVYRAVRREELTAILAKSGLVGIRWLMPQETSFYQPIVVAFRP